MKWYVSDALLCDVVACRFTFLLPVVLCIQGMT
jgi:hypothetical protein